MFMFLILLIIFARPVVLMAVSTGVIKSYTMTIGAADSSGMLVHTY